MKFENIPDRSEEPVAWTETKDHKMTDSAGEVETQQRNACINQKLQSRFKTHGTNEMQGSLKHGAMCNV